MKKTVKIISAILIAITIVTTLGSVVLAADGAQGVINKVKPVTVGNNADAVVNIGNRIVGIIQVVGIIVAVLVLMIVGIKYMMGSAEEKAEYKKVMIPYVIGAILIFAATTIVNVVYQISQNLTATTAA